MLAKFKSKKNTILDALRKPAADYEDLSPKGQIDVEIRNLIDEINNLPDFVTTSSCAGRIAVYLEGEGKNQNESLAEEDRDTAISEGAGSQRTTGGKGGGKWLFVTHKTMNLELFSTPGSLFATFCFSKDSQVAFPPADPAVRFVHLKFEPMILHVLAASAEGAQAMVGAGLAAGFRESGVTGLVDSKGRPSVPMVGVRSAGLAIDCIIGFMPPSSERSGARRIQPMVTEQYLRTVVQVANERFRQNVQRKERFREKLLMEYAGSISGIDIRRSDYRRKGGYQTALERKAEKRADDMRKREEALERRTQALLQGGALDGTVGSNNNDVEDEDLGLGALLISRDGRND